MQIIPQPVEMTVLTHTPLQELLYNTSRSYITQEKIMCPIYPVNTSILRFLDLFLVFSFCLSLPFCLLLSENLFILNDCFPHIYCLEHSKHSYFKVHVILSHNIYLI